MAKKKKGIFVKECVVEGQKVFGITDGKKWFFYAYSTQERAEGMLKHFDTPTRIDVNICNPSAFKLAADPG